MKHLINFRPGLLLAAAFGAALLVRGVSGSLFEPQARAQEKPAPGPGAVAAAPMDLQTLTARLPDQSHAMQDAGYHFENLWFAGDQQNWPLASYYLRKTQSYLQGRHTFQDRLSPDHRGLQRLPYGLRKIISSSASAGRTGHDDYPFRSIAIQGQMTTS
jgi:hypothetical protein